MSTDTRLDRRRRWWWACAVASYSIGLLVPAGASGATVSVVFDYPVPDSDVTARADQARYVAAPGERNRLAVSGSVVDLGAAAGTVWMFSDPGAVITPGNLCTAIDQHTVRCVPRPYVDAPTVLHTLWATVDVGDLDDEVSLSSTAESSGSSVVHGGPGADQLSFSPGPAVGGVLHGDAGDDVLRTGRWGGTLDGGLGSDRLTGGASNDDLSGGGGADVLDGGRGADSLRDGDVDGAAGAAGPGPDVLVGGPGTDSLFYDARSAAVRVDLASHTGGEAGERDWLSSVEIVHGGRGDDRLAGDDTANQLLGGRGRDRLIGRGGNDTLDAGGNPLEPPGAGSIACGPGRDVVPTYSRSLRSPNALTADCEYVSLGDYFGFADYFGFHVLTASPRAASKRRLRYRVWCPPKRVGTVPCSIRLRIREAAGHSRLLAKAALPQHRWWSTPIDARLTRLGRRLAGRRHGVRALVAVRLRIDYGQPGDPFGLTLRWITRLKTPRPSD